MHLINLHSVWRSCKLLCSIHVHLEAANCTLTMEVWDKPIFSGNFLSLTHTFILPQLITAWIYPTDAMDDNFKHHISFPFSLFTVSPLMSEHALTITRTKSFHFHLAALPALPQTTICADSLANATEQGAVGSQVLLKLIDNKMGLYDSQLPSWYTWILQQRTDETAGRVARSPNLAESWWVRFHILSHNMGWMCIRWGGTVTIQDWSLALTLSQ